MLRSVNAFKKWQHRTDEDEIIEELSQSRLPRYQIGFKIYMKVCELKNLKNLKGKINSIDKKDNKCF